MLAGCFAPAHIATHLIMAVLPIRTTWRISRSEPWDLLLKTKRGFQFSDQCESLEYASSTSKELFSRFQVEVVSRRRAAVMFHSAFPAASTIHDNNKRTDVGGSGTPEGDTV